MIVYYSEECGSCKNSQTYAFVKSYSQQVGVQFQDRRTVLWKKFEDEAEEISKVFGVKLPFFYATNSNIAKSESDLPFAENIKQFINEEKENE